MKKIQNIIFVFFQVYFIFIISWYMPFSYTLKGASLSLSVDLFLLYILIQSLVLRRFILILLGLFIGFLIDIDLESNLIGINSFLMPILCYFLGFLKLNSNNWKLNIKIIYLVSNLIIFHFSKFLFYQWTLNFPSLISVIINSLLILIALLSINKYFIRED